MSDYVWVSNMNADSMLTKYMSSDVGERTTEQAQDGLRIKWFGKPAPPDYGPRKIWADEIHEDERAMRPKYTPEPLFDADGFWIVCSKAAEILRGFDLGGGTLNRVSEGVWAPDPAVRDPDEWFCWTFGNAKKAFLQAHSPQAPGRDGPELRDVCNMPFAMADDVIAVSADATRGPDVWIDRGLARSVFLSRALGDALDSAGLGKAFRIYRARVV
ncbi:MAG: hypothetical protein ABWX67_11760 [Allosphingosinicella sp.]